MLAFAGLWDRWIDPENFDEVISATIIVSGASAWMAPYHDRMPCWKRRISMRGLMALWDRMR